MRDYWLTQYLLGAIGWGYVALVLLSLTLAVWLPKHRVSKAITAAVILGLASILPLRSAKEISERRLHAEESKQRYLKAKAVFDERCKIAGEKFYRTVEGVEGVLLLKVRLSNDRTSDPLMPGAAAAHENYGDDYIRSFLLNERDGERPSDRRVTESTSTPSRLGYRFVDSVDSSDHTRYRYTLASNKRIQREKATDPPPRYAVTFEDIVDPEERSHWVAGSVVKVFDLRTNEILGEHVRYVIEPGQGSRDGGRSPWLFARACDVMTSYGRDSPRLFATQVLKPTHEASK